MTPRTLSIVVVVAVAGMATPALADPAPAPASAPAPVCDHPWTVNLEAAGRGGHWGVGVERELGARYYVGGLGSVELLRGDDLYMASAYGGLRLLGTRHVWRADLGVTLAHERVPSPVPEWEGYARTGASAVLGSGYEYRGRLRWRAGALLMVGTGGIYPWLALSVGLPF